MKNNVKVQDNAQSLQSCVSDSFSDDDFIDWWLENEPDLTEEEQKQSICFTIHGIFC